MLPRDRIRRMSGFGVSSAVDCYAYSPRSADEVLEAFAAARESGRRVALRGAGQSYGDAATLAENVVIDLACMDRILAWDAATGIVDCEPGATLGRLWRHAIADGYWPPVMSGTAMATVGGAIAANIHGKDHFSSGCLAEHTLEIDVLSPSGRLETLRPDDERFWAVCGGFGLFGVVTRARIQMRKVPSGRLNVLTRHAANLSEHFDLFREFESTSDAVVSWLDCFRGGRGVFEAATLADTGGSETLSLTNQEPARTIVGIPRVKAWKLLRLATNDVGMRILNLARYVGAARRTASPGTRSLAEFSYQLDFLPGWQNAYLPGGVLQLQSFVPAETAAEAFRSQLARQREAGIYGYLAVMKRHRPDKTLLSYSLDGFSLATDFRATARNQTRLRELMLRMADDALNAGGRFYFAKDFVLDSRRAHRFLGEEALARLKRIKAEFDPEGLLATDLAVRLGLAEPIV